MRVTVEKRSCSVNVTTTFVERATLVWFGPGVRDLIFGAMASFEAVNVHEVPAKARPVRSLTPVVIDAVK